MEMKNFFKRIWNYFFGTKKQPSADYIALEQSRKLNPNVCRYCLGQKQMEFKGDMVNCPECNGTGERIDWIIESKTIEHKVEQPKPQTQLFRNQQLPGKIYNIGKSRFRINKKLTETADGRLKYIITKLI